MTTSTLSQRLRALRREKGLTQLEVASLLSISNTTLSQYESGKRTPSFDALRTLSSIYECTADYLLGLTERKSERVVNTLTENEIAALDKLKRVSPPLFQSMLTLAQVPQQKLDAFARVTETFIDIVTSPPA